MFKQGSTNVELKTELVIDSFNLWFDIKQVAIIDFPIIKRSILALFVPR